MKLTRKEFHAQPRKAITLLGMSGVGKTRLSAMLAGQGWVHYSCDYEIGMRYLQNELSQTISIHDLTPLSAFIGKIGNPEQGGLSLKEFKRRQALYAEAECSALAAVERAMAQTSGNFLNDSTGSLCEVTNEPLMARLGKKTLFVYIAAGPEDEERLLARATARPKPLYFPPGRFDAWLGRYMKESGIATPDEIAPDSFSRWVFPHLFRSRLPKYESLAARYGVRVPATRLRDVQSEQDILSAVAEALPE